VRLYLKGIGFILFLKNGLKKNCRKNYKNNLKSNNYEVCTAVARCFTNSLDVMVLENILSSNTKYEMVGKIPRYSLCIMTSQCKMTLLNRSQCKMMSLCTVSSRELKKQTWDRHIYSVIIIISSVLITILQNLWWFFNCNLSICHIFDTSKFSWR
jgi:hypothetical protein